MTELPNITTQKRWRITMADKTTRTLEARGFRVEHGALLLVQPRGCAAAYCTQSDPTAENPWVHASRADLISELGLIASSRTGV